MPLGRPYSWCIEDALLEQREHYVFGNTWRQGGSGKECPLRRTQPNEETQPSPESSRVRALPDVNHQQGKLWWTKSEMDGKIRMLDYPGNPCNHQNCVVVVHPTSESETSWRWFTCACGQKVYIKVWQLLAIELLYLFVAATRPEKPRSCKGIISAWNLKSFQHLSNALYTKLMTTFKLITPSHLSDKLLWWENHRITEWEPGNHSFEAH